jgi:hypothetical protein
MIKSEDIPRIVEACGVSIAGILIAGGVAWSCAHGSSDSHAKEIAACAQACPPPALPDFDWLYGCRCRKP